MSSDPFDGIMASLDAPLVIVTTAFGNERAGCLIGFHTQSSIEIRRYCLWVSKANRTYRIALRATHLAVHFLSTSDTHRALATLFGSRTGDSTDKFSQCASSKEDHGIPILNGCPNHMVVRRTALLDEGGDHVCVVAEPIDVRFSGRFMPLRVSDVEDLEPGHEADETATT